MDEKTTQRSRICSYCNRRLPISMFPVKPGFKYRYKVCSECRALGHSCIRKEKPKRRTFASEEERIAYRKAYMKAYRQRHADRIKEMKREYYARTKDMAATYVCVKCGIEKPVREFVDSVGRRRYGGKCLACRRKEKELKKKKPVVKIVANPVEVPTPRPKVISRPGCEGCANYPCFEGFENTESDFAREGCHQYKASGHQIV